MPRACWENTCQDGFVLPSLPARFVASTNHINRTTRTPLFSFPMKCWRFPAPAGHLLPSVVPRAPRFLRTNKVVSVLCRPCPGPGKDANQVQNISNPLLAAPAFHLRFTCVSTGSSALSLRSSSHLVQRRNMFVPAMHIFGKEHRSSRCVCFVDVYCTCCSVL